jgi:hypothetical protein
MRAPRRRLGLAGSVGVAVALALAGAGATGCSVGQGTGDVHTKDLYAPDCWGTQPDAGVPQAVGACYDMQPDFFAAVPYYNTLTIQVQRGSDLTEVSDGILVVIDDLLTVRAAIQTAATGGAGGGGAGGGAGSSDAGADGGEDAGDAGSDASPFGLSSGGATEPFACDGLAPNPSDPSSCFGVTPPPGAAAFRVDVPAGVHNPGSSTQLPPDLAANPPIVHMSLYLGSSCPNQNTVLEAVDGWVAFTALFDGNADETSAAQKLTDATFNVELGDVQNDVPVGDYVGDVPPGLRSRLCGSFRFYFERGQPAQPFP